MTYSRHRSTIGARTPAHGCRPGSRTAVKAIGALCAAVFLMALTVAARLGAQEPSRPRADTPEAILARLRDRAGVSPIECGRHARVPRLMPPAGYTAAVTASVRCVLDAAAQRRQSWMLAELQGIDSWVAVGLVSGADGVVQRFSYDSDPSGGGGAEPHVRITPCGAPTVSLRDYGVSLDCGNTTDGR